MTWPPTLPPNTRGDLTPQETNHPDDHNLIADALAAVVAEVDAGRVQHTIESANVSNIDNETAVLTTTIDVEAGRTYWLEALVHVLMTSASNNVYARIRADSAGGVGIAQTRWATAQNGHSRDLVVRAPYVASTTGAQTIVVTLNADTGVCATTNNAASQRYSSLTCAPAQD